MMSSKKICKEALEVFGEKHQVKKCIEELNELAVALAHYLDGKDQIDHVAEEIADVEIMLQQMLLLLGCQSTADKYRTQKMESLVLKIKSKRAEEEQGNG